MDVLIVERSSTQRRILTGILEEHGYSVNTTDSGETALRLVQEGGIDVLITGLELPDLSGFELCWHVKAGADTQPTYCLVVTAGTERGRQIEALDSGADDFLRKPYDPEELRARLRAGTRILTMQRRLIEQARTDPLTGAFNRRHFAEQANDEIERTRRHGRPLSVLMLDIDHFKSINDTYGHGVGDDAIKAVVIAASAQLRANDVLGRLGGEEFGVLLPETSMSEAVKMAERLRTVVSQIRLKTDSGTLDFTASFGVAAWEPDDETVDTIVNRADAALYVSKEQGRNRVTAAPQAAGPSGGEVV